MRNVESMETAVKIETHLSADVFPYYMLSYV
jgi:hypothetical protein